MNFVISICNPDNVNILKEICHELSLPINVILRGRGTAVRSMLDLLGLESNEKRVLLSVADNEKLKKFIKEQKKKMFIGVPGHGIVVSVPIKSIGGKRTMEKLNADAQLIGMKPEFNPSYELIVAIANEGRMDNVMNAARAAGATGGTVLHGKGEGGRNEEKFYNVSIASEKEVILIVARKEQKSDIMRSILEKAGPNTDAEAIVFSLPTSEVAGFGMFDDINE